MMSLVQQYAGAQDTLNKNHKDDIKDSVLLRMDSLAPVIVRPGKPSIRLKSDTLEYITSNIKLKTNATIEDLLRALPGIQVEQDGSITALGKKVQRVLIDGQDLFSRSPNIVTKNFNASVVAKIEVLDRKSEHAEFTGIDDGQRITTVNLVLTEQSRHSHFGKTELGGNGNGYYDDNLIAGSFNKRQQLIGLAIASNVGTTGVAGGSGDVAAGLSVTVGTGDALNASAGSGIPQVRSAGLHYANIWNGSGDHIEGNYSVGWLSTRPISSSITQQILPDSLFTQKSNNSSTNRIQQQNFDVAYDFFIDSLSAFQFTTKGSTSNGQNELHSLATSAFNDSLINSSESAIRSNVNNRNFQADLLWRLKNRNRKWGYFTIGVRLSNQFSSTNGYVYSFDRFYPTQGGVLIMDTTDERKVYTSSGLLLNGTVTYAKPLWKDASLDFIYGISNNTNKFLQDVYAKDSDSKYENLVDSLSSQYVTNIHNQHSTILLQQVGHLLSYGIGGDFLYYQQAVHWADSTRSYSYSNIEPRFNIQLAINKNQDFSLTYSASTQAPSVTQLAPIVNNNDPLHVFLGNKDLRPSVRHRMELNFRSVKLELVNIRLDLASTNMDVSTQVSTDSLGRQVNQAQNVNGSKFGTLNIDVSHRLKSLGLEIGATSSLSLAHNINYVGDLLSHNNSNTIGGGVSLSKFVAERYSLRINSGMNLFYTRSSVNLAATTRYWVQTHTAELSYFLYPGMELNTSCNYTLRQKTSIFEKNNATMLWNSYLSQNFLKNRLVIKWRIDNILGKNLGITRVISGNTISENAEYIIGRYSMLSVIYHFNSSAHK